MAIHTNDFKGSAQENITFLHESANNNELFERIKSVFLSELDARGIPYNAYENIVKSGGIFGTKLPILVISHPDKACKYFDIGVYVNNTTVCFPLLGESAENTKYNTKEYYKNNGNHLLAAATRYDEFKLQQEWAWRQQVLDCFNANVE
ncbi:MAG: hypothetical protein IJE93_01235 [Clostridia bacterium]|nr:hypothetical protein [Clostridia bacterium]